MILNIYGKGIQARFAQIILGLIMALTIYPPAAKAQFAVTVVADTTWQSIEQLRNATQQTIAQAALVQSSETSRLKQLVEYIKLAEQWSRTVTFYTDTIFENVRQFTSLKGILSAAEKQIGLNDDTLKALADIGALIRGSLTLKNNFMSMIRTRLSMIETLSRRAENGIFDPRADMEDVENYLKYSIGRESERTLISRARLAEQDPEIERLSYELRKVRATRVAKQQELQRNQELLDVQMKLQAKTRNVVVGNTGTIETSPEQQSSSAAAIAMLQERISALELQIQQLDQLEKEYLEKLAAKYGAYHTRLDDNYFEGHQWIDKMRGFRVFSLMKQKQLGCLIDNYETEADCSTETLSKIYGK